MVFAFPRCSTMLSPKIGLTKGRPLGDVAAVAWPGVGCARAAPGAAPAANRSTAALNAPRRNLDIMKADLLDEFGGITRNGSCGRPACHRCRCIARVWGRRRAAGCGPGMLC